MELQIKKYSNPSYCSVPQCKTYRSAVKGTSLFKIPKYVIDNPKTLKKWATALGIEKFSNHFKICSKHFDTKFILKAASKAGKINPALLKGAFPSQNLPVQPELERRKQRERREILAKRRTRILFEEIDNDAKPLTQLCKYPDIQATGRRFNTVGNQCDSDTLDKGIQVYIKPNIVDLWDTDSKLNIMTGIPTGEILKTLIEICQEFRRSEKYIMSLKERILLSFHKLKSDCSFAELAIFYQISDRTAKLYFDETIQLLAKATKCLIYWQTKDENLKSLPKCFKRYPNVRTILGWTEIKTTTFNCLSCGECTDSHYKGTDTLKFLIGVAPSGSINYVGNVTTGKSSDKAIFNLTDLINKLDKDDAVMVNKDFLLGDEFANAGIEIIRSGFTFQRVPNTDAENNTNIDLARVHVERSVARLKQFKILRGKICLAVIPYIDEIVGTLCALSNITPPTLTDDIPI